MTSLFGIGPLHSLNILPLLVGWLRHQSGEHRQICCSCVCGHMATRSGQNVREAENLTCRYLEN